MFGVSPFASLQYAATIAAVVTTPACVLWVPESVGSASYSNESVGSASFTNETIGSATWTNETTTPLC